jgi:hypothetical protein
MESTDIEPLRSVRVALIIHSSVRDRVDSSRSRDDHEQWLTPLDCASHPNRGSIVYKERPP